MALRVEAPLRLRAVCDPVRLGQVLDNLLSNAVNYSPEGGPVTVRVERDGDTARLRVADRGMGLPAEDAERVLERFGRSRNARMSAIPGLGLGLAVARTIVEDHGGTIRCDSVLGEGTVFTVELPVRGPLGGQDPGTTEAPVCADRGLEAVEPPAGIEPATFSLRVKRSTD